MKKYSILIAAALMLAGCTGKVKGPCDIYEQFGTKCVAAHSTTRKLYSKYDGPLYQVVRESDGKTLDIGTIDGGYADAAAQDVFLEGTIGYISIIYDQTGHGNDLIQASPGTFNGPAKGEFNTLPIADMAPVSVNGHKAYGAYFMPGMGLRNNNASYMPINDEPEGIYYVVNGNHFDSGCCFDYGNSSTNGRAVGRGTMETTYFGTSTNWGSGNGDGPWIMADMESGLFSGFNAKKNDVPSITEWEFVTAYVNGGGGNKWDLRGGDATKTDVVTFYEGERPSSPSQTDVYFPMSKKGGLLLANGGDNGNGSAGTFYEGVITAGYPSFEAVKAVQANIAAVKYARQTLQASRLRTFRKEDGRTQNMSVIFHNNTSNPIADINLGVELPEGWQSEMIYMQEFESILPGHGVSAVFRITMPDKDDAGFAKATAEWDGGSEFTSFRIRSAAAVSINEISLGNEQFIELYNASDQPVDLSGWEVEITRSGWAPVRAARLPAGTVIKAKDFLVMRPNAEALQFDEFPLTKIFIPVSTAPKSVFKAGSTSLPVTSVDGLQAGQKIGIDLGGKYEEVTLTKVGTPGTQTVLVGPAKAGDKTLNLEITANLSEGMEITISTGQRKEVRKITKVIKVSEAPQPRRFGQQAQPYEPGVVEIDKPLTIDQIAGVDVWAFGTGIEFTPALRYDHMSGDAISAPFVKPANDGSYSYTYSTRAGAIALYHGDVPVDAVIYGSKQSNSSANGTICRPDLAVLEGEQTQGGCLAEVPQIRMPRGMNQGQASAPTYSLVRMPDGNDRDALCEIQYTRDSTPGTQNTLR
ncbi:MAG: lamin tail domain-containing protein [Bacteroidaceae bacterium]|nr:lamin tail domain-containing protein [Bacteroidaceae bacterium]